MTLLRPATATLFDSQETIARPGCDFAPVSGDLKRLAQGFLNNLDAQELFFVHQPVHPRRVLSRTPPYPDWLN
jgi:hypothetical protein